MPVICVTELKSISPIATKSFYRMCIPAVLLTVGIAVISLWEAPQLPPPVLSLGDKVLHGLMYTVLAVAWMVPVAQLQISNFRFQISNYSIVCLAVTAYGALMELLQFYCTRTRSGEWLDVLADFVGALIGVAIVGVFEISRSRHNKKTT